MRLNAAVVLIVSVWLTCCSSGPAPTKKWASTDAGGLSGKVGARLDVEGPEWVGAGADFDVNVVLSVPDQANQELAVTDKMFFVQAGGCEVTAINDQPPRRFSELLPEYRSFAGDSAADPYAPADDEIVLDAAGQYRAKLRVKALTDKRCRLEIWNGVWAKAVAGIEIK